jgi:thiol:disulfide interchange protein
LAVAGLGCLMALTVSCSAPDGAPSGGDEKKPADIYDTTADGEEQIKEALAIARRDNKRVLLQFGGNWCIWCHRMHKMLTANKEIAKLVVYEYVLVLIDVALINGKMHNEAINERYGNPRQHGLPAWVVLDADGKQLATIDTAKLEIGDTYEPAKIMAALEKYKAEPASAEAAMSSAIARAKSESKKVFAYFSAPWCKWCQKFDFYFAQSAVSEVFDSAFVRVKIDVERMTGGEDVAEKYGKSEATGIPFFAVLDGNGRKLLDSVGPQGNVGFPVEDFEIVHYMDVMTKTSGRPAAKLAKLEKALKH